MLIHKKIIETAFSLLGKVSTYNSWQKFQFLSESQWWPREKLEAYQWKKLKETITHAYENVPFYHELWKCHNVHPEDIREPADMRHIPVICRDEIDRERCVAKKNVYQRGMSMVTTSGTTGKPFSVYIDLPAYQVKFALWLREFSCVDFTFGKKVASFWHRSYRGYMRKEPHTLIRDIVWKVLTSKKIFPPLPTNCNTKMDQEQGMLFYERLKKFRPFLIESLYYFILILTNFILDNKLECLPITKMFMHGVPSPKEKRKIEKVFPGIEIYDRYSSHEFEGLACACSEHSGMHISSDSYFVEFVREDNTPASPEEMARIIITDLDNKAMPLIRYEIRDMGMYLNNNCPCGRGLPLMSGVAGRKNEYIVSEDGRKLYFSFFHHFFDRYEDVRYFQVHQRGRESINVGIVKEHATDENRLSERISRDLNENLHTGINVSYIDALPEENNGKISPIKRVD